MVHTWVPFASFYGWRWLCGAAYCRQPQCAVRSFCRQRDVVWQLLHSHDAHMMPVALREGPRNPACVADEVKVGAPWSKRYLRVLGNNFNAPCRFALIQVYVVPRRLRLRMNNVPIGDYRLDLLLLGVPVRWCLWKALLLYRALCARPEGRRVPLTWGDSAGKTAGLVPPLLSAGLLCLINATWARDPGAARPPRGRFLLFWALTFAVGPKLSSPPPRQVRCTELQLRPFLRLTPNLGAEAAEPDPARGRAACTGACPHDRSAAPLEAPGAFSAAPGGSRWLRIRCLPFRGTEAPYGGFWRGPRVELGFMRPLQPPCWPRPPLTIPLMINRVRHWPCERNEMLSKEKSKTNKVTYGCTKIAYATIQMS
ncbi:hypothetical protein NDU88_002947 [Pleurodeles waltl]|uniref:Uncharacterized protein n=1 Tax=Pleurodeles waltl TaxID=8319 RepID=A0AAV7WQ41_PLEWA|nr:hypothetical protein NDU88_002947 [Pleurodeles waltl]